MSGGVLVIVEGVQVADCQIGGPSEVVHDALNGCDVLGAIVSHKATEVGDWEEDVRS